MPLRQLVDAMVLGDDVIARAMLGQAGTVLLKLLPLLILSQERLLPLLELLGAGLFAVLRGSQIIAALFLAEAPLGPLLIETERVLHDQGQGINADISGVVLDALIH